MELQPERVLLTFRFFNNRALGIGREGGNRIHFVFYVPQQHIQVVITFLFDSNFCAAGGRRTGDVSYAVNIFQLFFDLDSQPFFRLLC